MVWKTNFDRFLDGYVLGAASRDAEGEADDAVGGGGIPEFRFPDAMADEEAYDEPEVFAEVPRAPLAEMAMPPAPAPTAVRAAPTAAPAAAPPASAPVTAPAPVRESLGDALATTLSTIVTQLENLSTAVGRMEQRLEAVERRTGV